MPHGFNCGDRVRYIGSTAGMALTGPAEATVVTPPDGGGEDRYLYVRWDRSDIRHNLWHRQMDGGYSPRDFELVEAKPDYPALAREHAKLGEDVGKVLDRKNEIYNELVKAGYALDPKGWYKREYL